tara:strand:+ start:1130 stop:1288 length:159 start_codon:yes stop_codon:yes gene_type:complete
MRGAELQFNPFLNKHEFASPEALPKFNPFSNKYEMAIPDLSINTTLTKMNTR